MSLSTDNVTFLWKNDSTQLDNASSRVNFSSSAGGNHTALNEVRLTRAIPLGLVLGAFIVFAIAGNILVNPLCGVQQAPEDPDQLLYHQPGHRRPAAEHHGAAGGKKKESQERYKCQCHQRKRPGFKAYNYRSSNISASGHSRKGSADHNSSCLNGSQRTLPSSASPSPSYLSRGLPTCPEGEMLYIWGTSTPSPSTPKLLPGNSQQGGLGAAKTPEEMSGGVFSFSFAKNRDKQGMHKDGVAPDNKV
ncbi:hypothetical protein fugu_013264 [Takifugu bimaculatus]|uniref:Uncharacterized protein n=1 Tax=Takifugu bimaculatus TaxID=433685 RepID=A0A4Z2C4K6_9TELE|nr:hypothetical protein fugu_013264 [Takifugu bimaculatus]